MADVKSDAEIERLRNPSEAEILVAAKDKSLHKAYKGLSANVDFLTIGQYLQPSVKHYPLKRYVHPDKKLRFQYTTSSTDLQTKLGVNDKDKAA